MSVLIRLVVVSRPCVGSEHQLAATWIGRISATRSTLDAAGIAIRNLLHSAVGMRAAEPEHPAETLSARVRSIFSPDGPLRRAVVGFESRAGAARRWPTRSPTPSSRTSVLLVEAGTGTGKTLAYLIPALVSGRRVLVSTGTKNLQEQIVNKDLPVVAQTIGDSFTATVMKGRGNYLCLHRLQAMKTGDLARQQRLGGFGAAGHEVDERILLPMLERWAVETETGDRAELADLPEDLAALDGAVGVGRKLPRHDLPALSGLLRHAHAPARRRIGSRHRQSSPAVRRRGRSRRQLRRGDSRLRCRGAGRGAPARRRGDAVLRHRRQQLPARGAGARRGARDGRRGPSRSSARTVMRIVSRVDDRGEAAVPAARAGTPDWRRARARDAGFARRRAGQRRWRSSASSRRSRRRSCC